MPSSLPTENSVDKTVETFGLGTYDYPQSGMTHGEDTNSEPKRKALPDDGGPLDPFGPDRLLSYPTNVATSMIPGDLNRPKNSRSPIPGHYDSVVHSVALTSLPPEDKSVTRTDYYDNMSTGSSVDDIWSNSGDDTYTSSSEDSLPNQVNNDVKHNNNTSPLGNAWSGYTIEDQAVSAGFPSTEFEDPQRYTRMYSSTKISTNINHIKLIAPAFLKEYGKKDLTRRHVMSFLAKNNYPQYLASDIIRYCSIVDDIHISDNLDRFPVFKTASSMPSITSLRDDLIALEIQNIRDPKASEAFRYAAADLSQAIALLERIGDKNA